MRLSHFIKSLFLCLILMTSAFAGDPVKINRDQKKPLNAILNLNKDGSIACTGTAALYFRPANYGTYTLPYGTNITLAVAIEGTTTGLAACTPSVNISVQSKGACVKLWRNDVSYIQLCGVGQTTTFNFIMPDCTTVASICDFKATLEVGCPGTPTLLKFSFVGGIGGNTFSPNYPKDYFILLQ